MDLITYALLKRQIAECEANIEATIPHIGDNGNWYLGDTDTSKPSRGDKGSDGKSAYSYAQDGGYTGTEEEFAEKLASEALIVHITDNNGTLSADKTFLEIRDTIHAGIPVLVDYQGMLLPFIIMSNSLGFGTFVCGNNAFGTMVATLAIEITENNEVNDLSADVYIPKTLPNPYPLTFTGAVTGSYDGSSAKTIEIPIGADGKSAYQYAQDGGYTGTEAEFAAKLAQNVYSKDEVDAALGAYITDVAALVGGDA